MLAFGLCSNHLRKCTSQLRHKTGRKLRRTLCHSVYTGQPYRADDENYKGNDVELECAGKQANQNAKQNTDMFGHRRNSSLTFL